MFSLLLILIYYAVCYYFHAIWFAAADGAYCHTGSRMVIVILLAYVWFTTTLHAMPATAFGYLHYINNAAANNNIFMLFITVYTYACLLVVLHAIEAITIIVLLYINTTLRHAPRVSIRQHYCQALFSYYTLSCFTYFRHTILLSLLLPHYYHCSTLLLLFTPIVIIRHYHYMFWSSQHIRLLLPHYHYECHISLLHCWLRTCLYAMSAVG